PGRHVGRRGEDVAPGAVVLHAGRVLRPQDVAVLASLGATPVQVARQPTVAVLVTGGEVLPCGARPGGVKIVDSNSVMLAALVRRDGGLPSEARLVPDRYETIKAALLAATDDVVLVSGGSSVGLEDHAPRILAEVGELAVHGVALRPASPTGLGFLGGGAVVLLPGHPGLCPGAHCFFRARAGGGPGGGPRVTPYPPPPR